jgi:MoaA/NifB/PqqE/SkfB family radical SAM enzyme
MITQRCVLNCGYCFRDTSKEALKQEIQVQEMKAIIDHLYHIFNIRKLTISGGEPLFLGGKIRSDFLQLIKYLSRYKFEDESKNLRVELLSNGVLMNKEVLKAMQGVVERITITIDSIDNDTLSKLGRNTSKYKKYFERFNLRIREYHDYGFEVKLHSVVTPVNFDKLEELAHYVIDNELPINRWKLYQYMSYGMPETDRIFSISDKKYIEMKHRFESMDFGTIEIVFKDNQMMSDSMVNLWPNGKIESYYQKDGERVRFFSKVITEYKTLDEWMEDAHVDRQKFERFHRL